MNVAILGTGNVGSILGTRLAKLGHHIVYGSRNPAAAKVKDLIQSIGENASAVPYADVAAQAEIIILAVGYQHAQATLQALGDVSGKIIVDTTNALKPDLSGLALPADQSAGENIAQWVAGAKVVKAFNTVGTNVMQDPQYGSDKAVMFICGDDAPAKQVTTDLCEQLGFDVIDCGALSMSHHLESLAMLWIKLAFVQGMGTEFAMKLIKR